ncbi:Carbonic anhydrase 2 [Vanrija pseudolonga]|uniref:Carbonic anhydrase n=1 Tax=Vanrija pseudolonga TaxID=143232 RepID=A0AAF1BQA4_9TREE|nr:Carbonic anhydrase 2 [Vanrija pseudolonga]
MSAHPELSPYLSGNAQWAGQTNAADPTFLPQLATGQAPTVLWIGCADSRVPESVIMQRKPGDVFVHRNIANQFQSEDDSANAVLNYGVLHLGATHVAIVGHTACGGCNAAYAAPKEGAAPGNSLGRFLAPLVKLRHSLPAGATADDLIKANVREGVKNAVASDTIQTAWAQGKQVYVHGWLYDLKTGLIQDLHYSQGPQ